MSDYKLEKGDRVRVVLEGEVDDVAPGGFWTGEGAQSNYISNRAGHVVSVELISKPLQVAASASGAEAPDIRVGDLVKATNKANTEVTWTDRVTRVTRTLVDTANYCGTFRYWDFEVLDRPLPAIDEELLNGAVDAYLAKVDTPVGVPLVQRSYYEQNVTAVINFVRQYDNTKESKA